MNLATYLTYLIISIGFTIWVAKTLHKHGRVFLVDSFHGNEPLADSVNHLLVVGFYLLNIGFITLTLKYGDRVATMDAGLEVLCTKVGSVLLVLGGIHLMNIYIFSRMRRKAIATLPAGPEAPTPPAPVTPLRPVGATK